jgi:hypothetical protein
LPLLLLNWLEYQVFGVDVKDFTGVESTFCQSTFVTENVVVVLVYLVLFVGYIG